MRNNHDKHKHAYTITQVFLVETLSGENHPVTAALLNYFIIMLNKLYLDYLTELCLSHGSMEIYPLEAPTTNAPLPTTIVFSNSYWMEKTLPTTEFSKSLSIMKPPLIHFPHAYHVSEYFTLGSQFAQHEKPNNSIVLHIKFETQI